MESTVKITAAEVNKLRQATGAGMMDCKKALVEAGGDFDKAIEVLRKQGQKVAEKRADRDNSEGAAVAKINADNTSGVAIVLGCETDFVGKNENFVKLANDLADLALNYNTKEEFLAADFGGLTVADKLVEQTGVIGEKLDITSFERLEAPYVGSYVHINKIAALVGLSAKVDNAETLVKDVAMQVASMGATTLSYKDFDPAFVASETEARIAVIEKDNEELARLGKTLKNVPKYISMSQLTPEVLAQAEEDAKAQLAAEGKPEKIWANILPGKMDRFVSDNTTLDQEQCLLDQNFIKDDKINVAKYVASYGDVVITGFKRASVG
ncbi:MULTISPECIES: translation elongation factor Ts [Aestuariibaculum]|uniref:Elongation factor Ts n=1 Tax=Aestuariibaculum lutulentum TaxID=2920935 RepID=A0ABS9RM05_9FLAO|nr:MULTISPECIES: translation elongation factor Ts [Aestuariibaculum]MCH4553979.1 translation elongation factor Ts [Aestuariibaculum lutulentum]MCR8669476.1 translation elongation factor Ts [Aestuariibaculum sp. M13]